MRYYGDFRSLDTSTDPKGQQYRVLVFTDYTGENPYQYETLLFPTEHTAGRYLPLKGTELTMAEKPFVVTYEGDGNIYKPYRCSTAEISFMQDNINLDFLTANGTSTLVVLLKRKNEVSEVNGYMYNSETGERLGKKTVVSQLDDITPIYHDYEPYRYDKFCYDVEWIGFATPETFSMSYDHERDIFTLNAQDAFSILQYKKYEWIGEADNYTVTALDIMLKALAELGTCKDIYITKALRQAGVSDTPFANLVIQQKNWYDEDGKPSDLLSVLTEILSYLNLTAIPYKDILIINHPNAIAEGWDYYDTYSLPVTQYIINWPSANLSYTHDDTEQNLSSTLNLAAEIYKSGGMTISTGDVYSSVTVECDEYPVETTLPSIADTDNVKEKGDVEMSDMTFYVSGGNAEHYHWERQYFQSQTDRIKLFEYEGSQYNDGYGTDEITDPSQQEYGIGASIYRPYCVILDDGGAGQGSASDAYHSPYSPARKYFFNTPNLSTRPSSQPWQPLLYVKSETMMLNDTDYMQLKGDWTFFVNANHNFDQIPYQVAERGEQAVNSYMYISAKVRCGGKWLKNGSLSYAWSSTEQTVKLYFGLDAGAAFGRTFSFNREMRNFDQIVIKLPVPDGQVIASPVEIWFNRPLGVSSTPCRNATLQNLELNILSEEYMRSRGEDGKANTNTEYRAEMAIEAVNEYDNITLRLSSTSEKSARLSQTAFASSSTLVKTPRLYNVPSGNLSIPEGHITANIVGQYSTPTIGLNLCVPTRIVAPYSRIAWARMEGKKFIVDAAIYDYEADRAEISIQETKAATTAAQTTMSDTTRRFRRNRDFLTDKITPLNTVILVNETLETIERSVTVTNGAARLTTDNETEGFITIAPSFVNGEMLVSVPNDINGEATTDDEELILTIND